MDRAGPSSFLRSSGSIHAQLAPLDCLLAQLWLPTLWIERCYIVVLLVKLVSARSHSFTRGYSTYSEEFQTGASAFCLENL